MQIQGNFLVGIPTYNGWRRVDGLLQNLRQRTPPEIHHTLVVCDDSGREEHRRFVRQICEKWGAQYVENARNGGVAASWNALSRSFPDHPYVVLLNDDVLVANGWLRYLGYALSNNPAVGAFSLNCFFITESDAPAILAGQHAQAVPLNVHYRDGRLVRNERYPSMPLPGDGSPGRVMCPAGCAFGFRREVYDAVGGFDERYFSFYEESVPGHEVVLVRDAVNGTRLTTMEELYRDFTDVETPDENRDVVRPSGLECLSASIRRDQDVAFLTVRESDVMSLESASMSTMIKIRNRAVAKMKAASRVEGTWAKVTGIVRHRRRSKVLHVCQKSGSVLVTENHSMVVPDGDAFRIVEPRTFVSETLPQAHMVPLRENLTRVDLGAFLRGWDQYRETESSMWYLGKGSTGKPSEKRPSPHVPRWLDLTSKDGEDFCWFMGFYVAEGSTSITTNNYGAMVVCLGCGTDRTLVEKAREIWQRVVGTKTWVTESVPKGHGLKTGYKLGTGHKLIGRLLIQMCGKGSRHKRVPDFIYDAPKRCKESFLSGYVAGDGLEIMPYSCRREARPTIHVETVSRALAAGLSILMSSLGKRFSLQYRPKYQSYAIRTINQFVGHRDTKAVEEVRDDSGHVYDLEVVGTHVFCAGVGPVVVQIGRAHV